MTKPNACIVEPLRKPVKCPSCNQNSSRECYPFCSKRCQDLDLHKWFSESYTLPSTDPADEFEES
ncbi:MAG: DNA gyrase inhibitor YacG [Pseudomonadota bacterium]